MTAQAIYSKFRRALRNETGATLTRDQILELAHLGVFNMLAEKEVEELCPETAAPSSSETTGSTSGGTANRPMSGRLPPRAAAPLSIAALSAGM